MKYLQDYTQEKQTQLFKETKAFFAFGTKQFNEQRTEGVKYVDMGMGLICPKENAKKLKEGIDLIHKNGIEEDVKENGIDAIINRELYNHECFYTGDPTACIEALVDYPVTDKKIISSYHKEYPNAEL